MSRTYQILIVAVASIAVVGGYWKFVLSPKRAQVTALDAKIADQQAQLAQTQATLADYTTAKQAYKTNYATLVRLGKAVPGDDDVRSLVVQLDAAAKRSGVEFENIDVTAAAAPASSNVVTAAPGAGAAPPGAVAAGSFSTLPFAFSFSGTFGTLSNFFSRLERFVTLDGDRITVNGRLLRLESIALQAGDKGWPAIRAQIGASTYVVPTAQAVAAGSAAATTATAASAPAAGVDGAPPASTSASVPSGELR